MRPFEINRNRQSQDIFSTIATVRCCQIEGSLAFAERCQILCGTEPDQEENTCMKRSDAFLFRKLIAIALLPSSD